MTTYGIYRERPRSAVLVQIVEDRAAAIERAERLSNSGHGPHLVAAYDMGGTDWTRAHQDVIRYNDPTAPRYLYRAGDWDSRSAWQPYRAAGPREAALIAERSQPGDTCTHAVLSDCPHFS